MEDIQKKEFRKIRIQRLRTVILIVLLMTVFGVIGFTYFHIATEGRLALRTGRNVKLALDMLSIECYGENRSIYSPNRASGMEDGVEQQIYDIVGQTGETRIISYDRSERRVEKLVYEETKYRVVYEYDETNGDQWRVDYLVTIFDYSD